MNQSGKILFGFIVLVLIACNSNNKIKQSSKHVEKKKMVTEIIIDSHYTFDEAIKGSKAPENIIHQLRLINVRYYSTDDKIHEGQLLTNKKVANDLISLFDFILKNKFHVAHAIPIVKYGWNDNLSMKDNNTYSFCYRNISYSKHATGMAIDINPYFNPVHWKKSYEYRRNQPVGVQCDTTVNGSLYSSNPVIREFEKHGFRWGHNFTVKFDDHHFEK
jgi:hypothetical protein